MKTVNGQKSITIFAQSFIIDVQLGSKYSSSDISMQGVVACTCNPATLEAKCWNNVGSTPFGDNSPLIEGWTV